MAPAGSLNIHIKASYSSIIYIYIIFIPDRNILYNTNNNNI